MSIIFLGVTLTIISLIVYRSVAYTVDKRKSEPKQEVSVPEVKKRKEVKKELRNLDIIQDIKDNYRKPLPDPVDLDVNYSRMYGNFYCTRLESYSYRSEGRAILIKVNGFVFKFNFLINSDYIKLPSPKGWTFKDLMQSLSQVVEYQYITKSSIPSILKVLWTGLDFNLSSPSEEDIKWFLNSKDLVCLALLSLLLDSKGFRVEVKYKHNVVCVEDLVYISPAQNTVYYEDYFFYKNYIELVNNRFNTSFKVEEASFSLISEELKPTDNGLVTTVV